MTIEERLQRLEDDRAIRDLKARYLRACDGKDPETVRDCLLPAVRIRYDGFPPFDNREDFVSVYRQFGCVPGIFDIHHAANGVIAFEHTDRARGQSNDDAYLYIVMQGSSGAWRVMFPADEFGEGSNRVLAGRVYDIPGRSRLVFD